MKFVPHDYQRYAIERMITDPSIGLFLDMGLGKTVITLTAINDLRYNRWAVARCLVVAPKKVAEATWTKEAQKWDHLQHLRIVPVIGTAQQRIKALFSPGDVWVIYATICRGCATICGRAGALIWWYWMKVPVSRTARASGSRR